MRKPSEVARRPGAAGSSGARAAAATGLFGLVLGLGLGCNTSHPDQPPRSLEPVDSNLATFMRGGGCYPQGLRGQLPSPLDQIEQIVLVNPEWAPVENGQVIDSKPVLVHGVAHVPHGDTGGDYPANHVFSDHTAQLELDEADRWLLGTGNFDSAGEARLEYECESGKCPDWAWLGEGDRVVALGRWIFDCGHPNAEPGHCSGATDEECILDGDCGDGQTCTGAVFRYSTEIHPPQATAVIRAGRGGVVSDEPDAAPTAATRVDVWVNADAGAAGDRCSLSHVEPLADVIVKHDCYPLSQPVAPINDYDFPFDVPLPPKPSASAKPTWRVVPRDLRHANAIAARLEVVPRTGGADPHLAMTVRMTQPAATGLPTGYAATIYAGWQEAGPGDLTHVRVTVEKVAIANALQPATPVVREVKTWRLQTAVNGEWQSLHDLERVSTGDVIPQRLVWDQYLHPNDAVHLRTDGVARICIDTMFGKALVTDIREIGPAGTIECLLTNGQNPSPGEIDVSYPGPDFGAGTGSKTYDVPSEGSSGGACSATTNQLCVTDSDCPSGESCDAGGSAYTLSYTIERLAS